MSDTELDRGGLRRAVVNSFSQYYIRIGIALASTMTLSRLLSPGEIGIFSVAMAVLALAHVFRDFGIRGYLVQEPVLTRERIRTALALSIIIGWTVGGLLYGSAGMFARFYGAPTLRAVLHVISLNLFLISFTAPTLALWQRRLDFRALFYINVTSDLVLASVQVGLAMRGFGTMSLAWASLLQNVATFVLLSIRDPATMFMLPGLKDLRRVVTFGGPTTVASLFKLMGSSSIDLILGAVRGAEAVGMYSRAQGLISLFQRDVMTAITQVAFPAFAIEHRSGGNLRASFMRSQQLVTGIALPFYALAAILARPLIITMFGYQWESAVPLVPWLALAFAISSIYSLCDQALYSLGWVRWACVAEGTTQVARMLFVAVAAPFGIKAVAISNLPVALIGLAIYSYPLLRSLGVSPLNLLRAAVRSALVGAGTVILPFVAAVSLDGRVPPFAVLAIAGVCGLGSWLAAIRLARHPAATEVAAFVRSQRLKRLLVPTAVRAVARPVK